MEAQESKRILIIEDEYDIRQLMCLHLRRHTYEITEASNGSLAYDMLEKQEFDLLIVDWMLPGMSGLELLSWIRKKNHLHEKTPVLFVTAKSEPENIVLALETGADDYIVKPFDSRILIARVSNLLRRGHFQKILSENVKDNLSIGDLMLDRTSHKVFIRQEPISLTLSEFLLLETLLINQGKVLSRNQLASSIQGEDININSRTIDTHTSSLRKKIGEYGSLIETVRGVGYRMDYVK